MYFSIYICTIYVFCYLYIRYLYFHTNMRQLKAGRDCDEPPTSPGIRKSPFQTAPRKNIGP